MAIQPKTAALITAGVAVSAGIAYMVYFDHKRRNDPNLKKKLKKEKKKAQKEMKKAEEKVKSTVLQVIEQVMNAAEKEPLPTTPEAKEKYFMEQVAAGESLCNRGEAFYNDAVLPFYLALRVYPAPMELIMIYQKTVPEPVFQMVINIMALDQQKRQNLFYEKFPPKETNVKLAELPAGVNEEGTPVVRRSLAADKDISEGEVIYSERPLVSALYPELEGSHCNYCLKTLDAENKVECPKCDLVAFCSEECRQSADTDYHQYLCSHNKSTEIKEADEAEEKNVALEFHETSKTSNTKYPYMIARFLSAMVAEELSKQKTEEKVGETTFGAWDHVDRFRYLETTASPESTAEISMLKQVLGPKVQGISEFLSDEIYLMLKGKMLYNAYGIPASASEQVEVRPSDEHVRSTDPNAKYIGAGLYKISTYIGQSEDNANVKLTFENDTLSVTALKDIKKDDELLASYTLPVPKKADYWVSQQRHWCKYCKKYVANNKPSIQLHENGRSHKDEVERFLRGVYQKGRQDKEDAESVRRELARIEQAALHSVGVQDRYKSSSSGSSSYADKPVRKATEYYVNPNVPTIEELRQQSEADKVKLQGREEWAVNKEIAKVGEWETVVSTPAAVDSTQSSTTNNDKNAESALTHDQGAEFQDDDEDQEDLHHFKIKEKEYPADLDIAPEQEQDSEPLTFKKRKSDGDGTTFKSRKKKPLRKKD